MVEACFRCQLRCQIDAMDMVFLASPSAALLFAAGTRIEIRPV
jgi:hypothetical protein